MKKIFVIIFIILLSSSIYGNEEIIKLVFLHTNDIHGHIFPYENKGLSDGKIGGFQYLSTLVRTEREKNPGRVLLLDGGDFAQGSIWSNLSYGTATVEMMNFLKYDCSVIGNHEFDWGMDKLEHMIHNFSFPLLSSNMTDCNGNFIEGAEPYIIKNLSGVKVGIIGVSCTNRSILPFQVRNSYNLFAPEEILPLYINILRNIHMVDIVVVLSHEGYERDREIAGKVPGIDLIIGAHSHTLLKNPVREGNTLIAQAGCYLAWLGKVEIVFNRHEKKIISSTGELVKIDTVSLQPDRDLEYIMERYRVKYDSLAERVIGKTSVDLITSKKEESNIGNLTADIIRIYGGGEIGIINSGAIRENIPAGTITAGKIYSTFPFDDTIVTMDLTGKDLIDLMSLNFGEEHGVLQVSGMKATYDLSRPAGERLVELIAGDKPVDINRIYRVSTVDFLALGGDGLYVFQKGKNMKDMNSLRDAITGYISEKSPLSCTIEGRQRIIKK
ncbi:MAG: bifunctional UDP-sugar hydrolase/5'-nucleotidase [Candidatus Eremiobacterota bacterium]